MNYWLGISKLSTRKEKIIIESEDGFNIIMNLKKGDKLLFNQCANGQRLDIKDAIFTRKSGTDQVKSIMGFCAFISNLGIIIKKHIINNKIKKHNLDEFYTNIFNIIKQILEV